MIETPRLRLRPWREEDKPAYERIINTPAMMEHLGGVQRREVHDTLLDRMMAAQARDGHSMWAVEMRDPGELAGICGVRVGGYEGTPVPDVLEIGWRVAEPWWGKGVAREAADASLAWAWANTDRAFVAAWTNPDNRRSWGLMLRLGMVRRPDLDFHHPLYAEDDPLGQMVVYTIDRPSG
jgi:RimJ/RimL family protein N-acetyltransferase